MAFFNKLGDSANSGSGLFSLLSGGQQQQPTTPTSSITFGDQLAQQRQQQSQLWDPESGGYTQNNAYQPYFDQESGQMVTPRQFGEWDASQSLMSNLGAAGLASDGGLNMGSIDPRFLSAITTGYGYASDRGQHGGAGDYGGKAAWDLIMGADVNRARTDPFNYANELLRQNNVLAGLTPDGGFADAAQMRAINDRLPGHSSGSSLLDYAVPAGLAVMGAGAFGAFGAGAAGAGGTGTGAAGGMGAAGGGLSNASIMGMGVPATAETMASMAPLTSQLGAGAAAGGIGGAAGAPLYSTPANIGGATGTFGGSMSTPAMTTFAGPTGSAVGGSAGTTIGATGLSGAGAVGGTLANAATSPANYSMNMAEPMMETGAFDMYGAEAYPEMAAGTDALSTGSTIYGGAGALAPEAGTIFGMNASDLGQLGGGLYEMYSANKSANANRDLLNQLNSENYDYRQNDALVRGFLDDPMSAIKKNPGYNASVDYLTKAGQRKMAAQGKSGSGNIGHYLADVLGKNAMDWYEKSWAPIRDSAGLMNYQNRPALGQVAVNAQQQADEAQRKARGEIFNAGRRMLPDLFKLF